MEIKRHFAFAAEKHPELVHYLNMTFAPWKRGEIVSSMDIKESDFRWPTIAAYLKLHGIPSYATPIFTKEELSSPPGFGSAATGTSAIPSRKKASAIRPPPMTLKITVTAAAPVGCKQPPSA